MLDDFGQLGRTYREADAAQIDPTTAVADLLSGLSVVAFNTAEGWARHQVLNCALELDDGLPAAVRDLVERACA